MSTTLTIVTREAMLTSMSILAPALEGRGEWGMGKGRIQQLDSARLQLISYTKEC